MRISQLFVLIGIACSAGAFASETPPAEQDDRREAREAAVTLNYCRASFHRMRKYPTKRVMLEEQAKILNNLNLNGIADQEVISLYTAVLDEIGRERIAERERAVIGHSYERAVRREMLSKVFVLGAEVGTAQYTSAIRTGATSWWDFRSLSLNRDLDTWKVEKTRLTEVMDKSSKFMDTFWKLAQKKNIPDKWLVRADDLDRLEKALAERDPAVRLRVLQRMERFMECYPPYYYHVARTQQALGQLFAASETYEKLAKLGHGHFRKDEMLAAALANRAAIQAYLHQPGAPQTALKALEYSNDAWQANLVCARVLAQHQKFDDAEDAILRNLDVNLERTQSATALVSLYCDSGNTAKLASRLDDPKLVADLPMPLLVRCAATLGAEKMPAVAMRQVMASLYAYEVNQFGRNELVVVVQPGWEVDSAETLLMCEGLLFNDPRVEQMRGQTRMYFAGVPDVQTRLVANRGQSTIQLDLKYADSAPVRLVLERRPGAPDLTAQTEQQVPREGESRDFLGLFASKPRESFVITKAEFGESRVAFSELPETTRPKVAPAAMEKITPITGVDPYRKPEPEPEPTPTRPLIQLLIPTAPDLDLDE